MATSQIPAPSIELTSFACPHCGAHATQTWFNTRLVRCSGNDPVPNFISSESIVKAETHLAKLPQGDEREAFQNILGYWRRLRQGEPFTDKNEDTPWRPPSLANVFVSECYTCHKLAIWLHDNLIYPPALSGPPPNSDLSTEVMRDYEEARSVLELSPRGAAALLRLAVEKICMELGAVGKVINQRIADLVAKGLPPLVQQALDAVRVIGNEAVHPGQLDLRDDRETALNLFGLVNVIAEDRITRPKQVSALYAMIPESKRDGIEARDAKALGKAE